MAAGMVVPISGPYTGTLSSFPIGTLSDDGYEIVFTIQGQEVNETDAYGQTLVEGIYRGQNWRLRLRGLEWKPAIVDAFQNFGQTGASGTLTPALSGVGQRYTNYVDSLVLTAILANPPTTPQTLTATNCVVAPNVEKAFNMTSKVRELPLEFVLIPYAIVVASLPVVIPFSTT